MERLFYGRLKERRVNVHSLWHLYEHVEVVSDGCHMRNNDSYRLVEAWIPVIGSCEQIKHSRVTNLSEDITIDHSAEAPEVGLAQDLVQKVILATKPSWGDIAQEVTGGIPPWRKTGRTTLDVIGMSYIGAIEEIKTWKVEMCMRYHPLRRKRSTKGP